MGGHNQAGRGGSRALGRGAFGRGRGPTIYYNYNHHVHFVWDFPNPYMTSTYIL